MTFRILTLNWNLYRDDKPILATPLIAGKGLNYICYNVTGNGGRECFKKYIMVRSATKPTSRFVGTLTDYRKLDINVYRNVEIA